MVLRSQSFRHPVVWIIALAVFIFGSYKYPLHLLPSSLDHRGPSSGLTSVPYELTSKDVDNYKWWTETRLRELASCTGKGNCPGNANKVAIFAAYHCHMAMFDHYNGGEGVWCKGMIENLEAQGFTVLHARDDWPYVYHIHRQIPDLVKVIIGGKRGPNGDAAKFYKSASRPDGIPAWKHFHFSYFPHMGESVVGDRWTLCAEPEWTRPGDEPRNYTFAGYSLEPPSGSMPWVPFAKRPHRVYILGKRIQYFHQWANPMWDPSFFTRAYRDMSKIWPDFEFVGGFVDDRNKQDVEKQGELSLPDGVVNLGLLDADTFDKEVSSARVMIGLGWPTMSPSPYRALAMGVPFINPHKMFDFSVAGDRSTWQQTQHATLRLLDEPYVYHTEAFKYDEFLHNIKTALETPIEPFRFDWHSRAAISLRMHHLMTADWQSEAAQILEARLAGKETQGRGGGANLGIFVV